METENTFTEIDRDGSSLGMFQALESIPSEPPPPTGISAALSTIPDVPPMEYRNPAPKKEYSWLQSQYQKFTGKSIEERRAEAAVAVAEHEMAGIPLNETLTDSQRAALYEDRSIKEALDVRIERTKSSSEIAWNRYHAAGNYAVAYGKGDIEAATNSMAAYKAANLQKQELKEVAFREGRGGKIVEGAADLFTQIAALVYGGADEAAQGASLGAMLGGFGAGAGAAPGAAIGAEIGFTYGSLSSAYYSRLGTQTLEKIAKGVDPDIAYRTSVISALVRTVADRVGAGYLVKNIPGVRKLFSDVINTTAKRTEIATLKAFGGESARMVGVETTQEMFDTLMETTDVELAKVLNNKLKGTNLTPTTAGRVAEELKETFDQVFHSMLLVGPFMTMVPYSVDTINAKVDKRNAEAALVKKTEEVIANLTVEEQKVQREAADLDIELEDDYGAQVALDETVPVEPGEDTHVVNEDGNRSPATPVSPIEEQQAMVDPTTTTDEDFDNLVMTPDEDLDVALEEHIAKLNSTGDRYGDFIGTLRRILPRKEAKAMEGFIKARAKATNRTKEQFVEDHGLSMRVAQDVTGKYTGSVEFIGDGETIIRAFQSTTLKDVAHEIGHVFRKDLSETEILQAEKAFGVKDGNWTEQNEEAFADGFVQFIATGEAPTKGLKKLFVKMQKWLGELYRSAKGTNVKVSPEMTEVYKRMFTAQANRDYRHSRAQARNDLKTLFAKKKKSTKTTIREATGQTPTRAGKAVDEHVAFKEGLRKRVQDAKKAASVGKQAGYEKARAKFKAIAERKKNRAALSKSRKKIRKSIQRLIKKSRPKKRQGKPTGMFTADFQDQADVLAEVMVMPVKEAKAIAATMALDEAHTGGSELDVLRNLLILTRANVPTMDEAQLTDLYNRLDTFFKGGRQQRRDELSDRFESIRKAKRMIRTSLRKVRHEEGISLDEREGYAKTKSLFARVKDGIRNKAALDFHGMMEMLDMGTESILGEGFARIWSETLDNERQSNTGRRIAVAKMLNAAAEAYDIRNPDGTLDPKRAKALLEDEFRKGKREITEIELLDKDGMPTGKYETLILDQGQLRKIWMEQMDGDLKESYEAYGFTEQDWLKIRAELSVQDITFIHKQLDLYREYFPRIGEVYERAEGVSFVSSSDFYSPVSRDMQGGTKDGPVMELRQDMKIAKYRSAGNKSLKSRVNTKKKLKIQNDLDVFNYYTRHMEHYIAFAEKVTQLNSVFHDKDVRADIIDTYGEGFYQVLDGMIENISRNGIRPAAEGLGGTLNSFARDIRINVAKGLIGGKVLSIPKQLSSFIGYSEKMPVGMFNTLVMEFLKNPKKNMSELKAVSEFIQSRGDRMERDLSDMVGASEYRDIVGKIIPAGVDKTIREKTGGNVAGFNELMMLAVKTGDIGAIYIGGWAYYKWLQMPESEGGKGMSQKEAVFEFERQSRDTQQSSELASLSAWQQGNDFQKLLTMFVSSQRQYLQKAVLAVEAKNKGRIDINYRNKMVGLYLVALPVLFQVISQGGIGDEDDVRSMAKAVVVSPLAPIPGINQVSNYISGDLIEGHTYGRGLLNIPIASPVETAWRGAKRLTRDDIDMEDIGMAVRDMLAILEYGGIPGRQLGNMGMGVQNVLSGDTTEGVAEIIGYSPYRAKKLAED